MYLHTMFYSISSHVIVRCYAALVSIVTRESKLTFLDKTNAALNTQLACSKKSRKDYTRVNLLFSKDKR
jgi:hypothetical protein